MDTEDELRTRRGKFLNVEEVANGYRETGANGEITEYKPDERPNELHIEDMALHATADLASGTVHHVLTGSTRQKLRAIGTEGKYSIHEVSVGPETAPGTVIIRKLYGPDGHALHSEMRVGLSNDAVSAFGEKLPGVLRLGGIEKGAFFTSGKFDDATVLGYWRGHVVADSASETVVAEWRFNFSAATLSPEGYSKWMGYHPSKVNERHVGGTIGIHFSDGHPLKETVENLPASFVKSTRDIVYALYGIAAVLVFLALKH